MHQHFKTKWYEIFDDINRNSDILFGGFKEHTSKQIVRAIRENSQESTKEWMCLMFEQAASKGSNVKHSQFWQHNNKPVELWSSDVIDQKSD